MIAGMVNVRMELDQRLLSGAIQDTKGAVSFCRDKAFSPDALIEKKSRTLCTSAPGGRGGSRVFLTLVRISPVSKLIFDSSIIRVMRPSRSTAANALLFLSASPLRR